MKKVLVTGGAGFIGSHIVERLLKGNNYVRVIDDFSSGKEENIHFAKNNKNFDLVKADIRDREACLEATKDIDCITHQAALRSVPKSLDNPHEFNQVNIDGTLNLLEAAVKNKIKAFVFASSSSIYGECDTFPQTEDLPSKLISPYALSKLAGEYYCKIFNKIYGLNTVSLRYFNVFGPRQALDDEYAVVIPKFITCILHDEPPPIHGNGQQSRDFTYVSNVVDANLLSFEKSDLEGQVLNVACGENISILELVNNLNTIAAKKIRPEFTPPRKGDVFKTLADISKVKDIIDFVPKTDFSDGLKLTFDYFKSIN